MVRVEEDQLKRLICSFFDRQICSVFDRKKLRHGGRYYGQKQNEV